MGVRLLAMPTLMLGIVLVILPFIGVSKFTITLMTEAMIFAIWAMSLDLLVGYTGLVSFGHAASVGLVSYFAGYLALTVTAEVDVCCLVTSAEIR